MHGMQIAEYMVGANSFDFCHYEATSCKLLFSQMHKKFYTLFYILNLFLHFFMMTVVAHYENYFASKILGRTKSNPLYATPV